MNKKTQNFQTSSKFHRLNRRKAGIFSCMRSARADWGKSHRQIIKFSRGLRFRAKICIFSTRKHKKISVFEFFQTFRATAPPDAQQNCRTHAKYAFSKSSFNCASNYYAGTGQNGGRFCHGRRFALRRRWAKRRMVLPLRTILPLAA